MVCIHERSPSQPSCANRGGKMLADALEQELESHDSSVNVERVPCLGHCTEGPNVRLAPGGRFFYNVELKQVPEIVAEAAEFQKNGQKGDKNVEDGTINKTFEWFED